MLYQSRENAEFELIIKINWPYKENGIGASGFCNKKYKIV